MGISNRIRNLAATLTALVACVMAGPMPSRAGEGGPGAGGEERRALEQGLRELKGRLGKLRGDEGLEAAARGDLIADAEVFAKGIDWALRFESSLTPEDLALLKEAIDRCRCRIEAIEGREAPWAVRRGRVVRGFVSEVDGSVQPYAVVVPSGYDPKTPIRLDVVLHGSSKPSGMSELRFLGRFDEGDGPAPDAPDRGDIELHPLGRVENGYRWAGESDVFEAIEAACRNYAIDRDRIVLRGMSMGASGTWHLGLKHPDRFVALGPYCGYVDTHAFSRTPVPNFVEVGPLPPHQEKALHMLDSVDYAANAGVVPAVACMGDKDVFFEAHEIMRRAMAKEGLAMVNLISPGTGHVIDPATQEEQLRRIGTFAAKGLDRSPGHIRFVTWTLKYSRCHWLQVLSLGEHYARAEVDAELGTDGTVEVAEPKNVIRIAGAEVEIPPEAARAGSPGLDFGLRDGRWACLGELDPSKQAGKRPGLQGPIDDAFTAPFLCVRGTGDAWDPSVKAWTDAVLDRFSREWSRYFRGDLPIKDDTEVTEEDLRRRNLILFGDPGSNSWIAKALPGLPLRWSRQECAIGEAKSPSAGHVPVLIAPNPLAEGRYVVLNSGHTFHEEELSTLNYLLFPRLGDWALLKIRAPAPGGPADPPGDEVVRAGFFDESWAPPGPEAGRGRPDARRAPAFRPPNLPTIPARAALR